MSSEAHALQTLTQAQAINIANYKHHIVSHSISFDRACLIEEEGGCRMRVLGYMYVEFPLPDGTDKGVISSSFSVEFGFNNEGRVTVFFDKENFYIFGHNFRILKDNGISFLEGVAMSQLLQEPQVNVAKYTPTEKDKHFFEQEIKDQLENEMPSANYVRSWWRSPRVKP